MALAHCVGQELTEAISSGGSFGAVSKDPDADADFAWALCTSMGSEACSESAASVEPAMLALTDSPRLGLARTYRDALLSHVPGTSLQWQTAEFEHVMRGTFLVCPNRPICEPFHL